MHHKKIVGPKGREIDEYLYSLIQERDIVQSAANILRQKILNIKKRHCQKIYEHRMY